MFKHYLDISISENSSVFAFDRIISQIHGFFKHNGYKFAVDFPLYKKYIAEKLTENGQTYSKNIRNLGDKIRIFSEKSNLCEFVATEEFQKIQRVINPFISGVKSVPDTNHYVAVFRQHKADCNKKNREDYSEKFPFFSYMKKEDSGYIKIPIYIVREDLEGNIENNEGVFNTFGLSTLTDKVFIPSF